MKKILLYLFNKNATAILTILIVASFLVIVLQSLRFFDLILNRGFPLSTLLYIAILTMPKIWVEILPFMVLIGTIFAWNQMLNNYEIIIMRAVGITPWQLGYTSIIIGICFSILSFIFVGFVIPKSLAVYTDLRNEIANNYNLKLIEKGKFNEIGNGITFYVKEIKSNEFYNIIIHNESTPDKILTIFSEKGYVDLQNNRVVFLLDKVSIIEENKKESTKTFYSIDKYLFDFNLTNKNTGTIIRHDPQDFYINELLFKKDIPLLKDLNKNSTEYATINTKIQKDITRRLSNSLFPFVLSIIIVYFFVTANFQRTGNTKTIIKSVVATLLLKTLVLIAIFANLHVLITATISIIIPLIIASVMLYKIAMPLKVT